MHKSRLGCIVIDCEGDAYTAGKRFWSGALGLSVQEEDDLFTRLDSRPEEVKVLLQRVPHESRVHLDIEADDIDAEAARLEKLGATRVAQIKQWWVMDAPSGHRFCIVKPQSDAFCELANEW